MDAFQRANNFTVLVVNIFGIRLTKNGPDQRRNHFLPALRQSGKSISEETNPTSLPSGARQGHLDSGLEAFVGVTDHQVNSV
jgi:hypothetical protein